MNYFINDSVWVKSKSRAIEIARGHNSKIFIYDACGLWKVIDADNVTEWERR